MTDTPEKYPAGDAEYFDSLRAEVETRDSLCPVSKAVKTIQKDSPRLIQGKAEDILNRHIAEIVTNDRMEALEAMLVTNAYSLNHLLHKLLGKTSEPLISSNADRLKTVVDTAIKCQRQIASTVELLARMKSPPGSMLIQQNIAHNQQVNNGIPALADGNRKIITNELLEANDYEYQRMDTGAQAAASRVDKELAAMETIHRRQDP